MAIVYLSIGSNIGDRLANMQQVTSFIGLIEGIKIIRVSAFYETEPWGLKEQPWFLNAVVELKTSLSAQDLLKECQNIEEKLGRNRENEIRWGERFADIDILFYDDKIIDEENLKIPHPLMHKRAFVLVPMLELAPQFMHPALNKTIEQLYEDLTSPEDVFLYGTI